MLYYFLAVWIGIYLGFLTIYEGTERPVVVLVSLVGSFMFACALFTVVVLTGGTF